MEGRITRDTSYYVGGTRYSKRDEITSQNQTEFGPSPAAAKTGTLTTRTDDDTGVVTLTGGHGLTDGVFDIFWSGGSRANLTGTVATNALSLDGGSGDVLPSTTTAVTVKKRTEYEDFTLDGDNVSGMLFVSPVPGIITFTEADGTTVIGTPVHLKADDNASSPSYIYQWDSENGVTNPVAGGNGLARIYFSHGDSSAAQDMYGAVLFS